MSDTNGRWVDAHCGAIYFCIGLLSASLGCTSGMEPQCMSTQRLTDSADSNGGEARKRPNSSPSRPILTRF